MLNVAESPHSGCLSLRSRASSHVLPLTASRPLAPHLSLSLSLSLFSPRYLANAAKAEGVDLFAELAPRWDAQGPVNTGFLYMRSSAKAKMLMHSLVALTPLMFLSGDDQVNIFNSFQYAYDFTRSFDRINIFQ